MIWRRIVNYFGVRGAPALPVLCALVSMSAFADSAVVRQRMVAGDVATELSEEILSVGATYSTVTPPAKAGYIFTHWTISTEQAFDARDKWGRAFDTPRFTVQEKTMLTAWYVPTSEDTDADGVPDGYEMYWYGNLAQTGESDTDGDGKTFAQELAAGTNPLMAETDVAGPILCGLGEEVVYNPTGYKRTVIRSEPEGTLVATSEEWLRPGAAVSTASYSPNNSKFAYWTKNGVPVRDKWGRAIDGVSLTMGDEDVELVAVTEADATARQKLYWYGRTDVAMDSDTDGDGKTFAEELASGTNPLMAEEDVAGPITYTTGSEVVYNPYDYKTVTTRSLAGESVEYTRPGTAVTTPTYAPGSSKFAYWTKDGVAQRDAWGRAADSVSFTMGTAPVELVAVTEADATTRQKLYWYGRTDFAMDSDTDGDGRTFAQEIAAGTNPLMAEADVEGPITVSTGAQIIYDPFGHVTDCAATVTGYSGTYDGQGHGITVKVTVPDYGYTVFYSLEEFGTYTATMPLISSAGVGQRIWYRIDPSDTDEYETTYGYGTVTLTQKSFGADITASLEPTSFTYDGTAKEPTVTVTDTTRGAALTLGTDYTVAYASNINVGTATVTVTGVGNYQGTKTLNFTITKGDIPGGGEEPGDDPVPPGGLSKFDATYVYDGEGHTIDTNKLIAAFNNVPGMGPFTVVYGRAVCPTPPQSQQNASALGDDCGALGDRALPETWSVNPPLYTNVGAYAVWYKVTSANYTDYVHAARVTITPAMKVLKIRTEWLETKSAAEQPDYKATVKTNGAAMATYALTAANGWKIDTTTRVHDDLGVPLGYAIDVAPIKGFITETAVYGCERKDTMPSVSNILTRTGWQRKSTVPSGADILTEFGWERKSTVYNSTQLAVEYHSKGELIWITNTAHRDIDDGSGGKSGDAHPASYVGVYDGKAHGIDVVVSDPATGATVRYATAKDGPYVDTLTFTNVCSHVPVWYEVSADGYNSLTNWATVTITNRSVTVTSRDKTRTYDGSPLKVTSEDISVGGDHLSAPLASGESFVFGDFGEQIVVGTSLASFSVSAGPNTRLSNYDIHCVTGTLTVTKATIDPSVIDPVNPDPSDPTKPYSAFDAQRIYNGSGQTIDTNKLVAAFSQVLAGEFTVEYAGDAAGGTAERSETAEGRAPALPWVTTPQTIKDVGELVVWYRVTSSNYEPIAPHAAKVTVGPKTVTAEMLNYSDNAFFFDGSKTKVPDVVLVDTNELGVVISTENDWTRVYGERLPTGEWPVTLTGRNNYTGSATALFKNIKRPVAYPVIPSQSYNGKTRKPTVTIPKDENGNDLYQVVENPGGVNAGFYTNVVLRLLNTTDYKWKGYPEDGSSDWTGVFEIRKASNGWSTYPGIESWTEGETPSEPKGKVRYGTMLVAYRVRGAAVETETATKPTKAGKYTARFWAEATENYAGVASREVDFEIYSAQTGGDVVIGDVTVPGDWLAPYVGVFGADVESAATAKGANGLALWESYVAGLDPTDATSQFTATITMGTDGKPVITWSPDLTDGNPPRTYTTYGRASLNEGEWVPVTDANKAQMKFFKVGVEVGFGK